MSHSKNDEKVTEITTVIIDFVYLLIGLGLTALVVFFPRYADKLYKWFYQQFPNAPDGTFQFIQAILYFPVIAFVYVVLVKVIKRFYFNVSQEEELRRSRRERRTSA